MNAPAAATGELVLALNCGSSSIKFALFDASAQPLPRRPLWRGGVQGLGGPAPTWNEPGTTPVALTLDAAEPVHAALQELQQRLQARLGGARLALVVHRVVHGGERYSEPVRLDPRVLRDLAACIPLAPLHQPHALIAIEWMLATQPGVPQVACFDTAFHRTLPQVERMLPLPYAAWERGLRRYGFHGLSYHSLSVTLAERHGALARGRTLAAHLGSGASLCAMRDLASVATTMGFSALEGLMMGTRSGSIDPGVLLHLLQVEGRKPEELSRLLYHESGLLGVSGISAEPRVLAACEAEPGERGARARLALDLYVRRIVRETGALTALLGGLDLLVFTAGVGENSALVRERVCAALDWLGIALDPQANAQHRPVISQPHSRVCVAVEPTNEEWIAATLGLACMHGPRAEPMKEERR